jgi:hypothetical protein
MQWGQPDDSFDPITQITEVTTIVTVTRGNDVQTFEQRAPQRCFTATEFRALVDASGRFRIVDWYGAMDTGVPFDNAKAAWRMVPVLQRA